MSNKGSSHDGEVKKSGSPSRPLEYEPESPHPARDFSFEKWWKCQVKTERRRESKNLEVPETCPRRPLGTAAWWLKYDGMRSALKVSGGTRKERERVEFPERAFWRVKQWLDLQLLHWSLHCSFLYCISESPCSAGMPQRLSLLRVFKSVFSPPEATSNLREKFISYFPGKKRKQMPI